MHIQRYSLTRTARLQSVSGIATLIFAMIAAFLMLSLSGCGVVPTSDKEELLPCGIDSEPAMPSEEMATLDLYDAREGLLRTANGNPFCPQKPCNIRKILLSPGEHWVIISYLKAYSPLGPGGRDAVKLTFNAKAGETYRVIVKTSGFIGWKYNCKIEEATTGRTVMEIKDCDRDEIRRPAINAVFDAYGGRQKYIDRQCYPHY